jgi:ferric-dicitrate binding protein FerR (iron transport regulator)
MTNQERITRELREWAYRPTALTGAQAARHILTRLDSQGEPPRRFVLRPVLVAAAAALVAVVAAYTTLRDRAVHAPAAGTTAAMTLSSGTQVVIELKEVKR